MTFGQSHASLQEGGEMAGVPAGALEILHMDFNNAFTQQVDPVFRIGENHHVSHVEISSDFRAVQSVDKIDHIPGRREKVIPYIFQAHFDAAARRYPSAKRKAFQSSYPMRGGLNVPARCRRAPPELIQPQRLGQLHMSPQKVFGLFAIRAFVCAQRICAV